MSVQVDSIEKNVAKMTIQIPADEFDKAIQKVYLKNKNSFNIPGFRRGKVPRAMIEKMYGASIFYDDAVNDILPDAYEKALDESGLEVTSRPELDITEIGADKGVTIAVTVAVMPEVTLGAYRGVPVAKAVIEATEEEVMAEIGKEQEKNSTMVTVEGRPSEMGDSLNIDFTGDVDGEAFEGGSGENYNLVLGSHEFIDNFEEQLAGHVAGDEVDVNVTFPEGYQNKELSGKPALFKVTVNEVQEKDMPEIDDEFASEVSEYDTLAEYKQSVKEKLEKQKGEEARKQKENEALAKVEEASQMDIPDLMVQSEAENMMENYEEQVEAQGIKLDTLLQYYGMTRDMLLDQYKTQALNNIRGRLVLDAVAKAEEIEVSDEEFEEEMENIAQQYHMEVAQVKEQMSEEYRANVRKDLAAQKALDLIVELSVETEEPE